MVCRLQQTNPSTVSLANSWTLVSVTPRLSVFLSSPRVSMGEDWRGRAAVHWLVSPRRFRLQFCLISLPRVNQIYTHKKFGQTTRSRSWGLRVQVAQKEAIISNKPKIVRQVVMINTSVVDVRGDTLTTTIVLRTLPDFWALFSQSKQENRQARSAD